MSEAGVRAEPRFQARSRSRRPASTIAFVSELSEHTKVSTQFLHSSQSLTGVAVKLWPEKFGSIMTPTVT